MLRQMRLSTAERQREVWVFCFFFQKGSGVVYISLIVYRMRNLFFTGPAGEGQTLFGPYGKSVLG